MSATAPRSTFDVRYVADLARLQLEPGEIDVLQRQLEQILGYVEELRSVDVEGVEPMAHPLARENVLRADEPVSGLDHETAMELAPEVRDGQFSVPSILE